jgi:hypothetical protein
LGKASSRRTTTNPLLDDSTLLNSAVFGSVLEWGVQEDGQEDVDWATLSCLDQNEAVEPVAPASSGLAKGKRDREKLFLQDVCVKDGVLADPRSGQVCEELKVYVRLSLATTATATKAKLPKKLLSAKMIRAHAVSAERSYRLVVDVSLENASPEEEYKLALLSPGDKPEKAPYFFMLHKAGGDVFVLSLVQVGDQACAPKLLKTLEVTTREAELVALIRQAGNDESDLKRIKGFVAERYGDEAYLYNQLLEDEVICLGDVVARVQKKSDSSRGEVLVTKHPEAAAATASCKVIGWSVVANHVSTLGFHELLPQPHTVCNPHGCNRKFVAVATRGVVAVALSAGEGLQVPSTSSVDAFAVTGQWLVASSKMDGCAVGFHDTVVGEELRRIGKATSVCGRWAFLEVNFEFKSIQLAVFDGSGGESKAERKARKCLTDAIVLKKGGNWNDAVALLKEGARNVDASNLSRAGLYCELGKCLLEQGKAVKALANAKKAVKLFPAWDEAFYLKSQCYLTLDNVKKALKAVDRGLALAPDRKDLVDLRERVYNAQYGQMTGVAMLAQGRDVDKEERVRHVLYCMALRGEDAEAHDTRLVIGPCPLTEYQRQQLHMEALVREK